MVRFNKTQQKNIINSYNKGVKIIDISKKQKTCFATISKFLKNSGIKSKRRTDYLKYSLDKNFFDVIDNEKKHIG